ncbi:MAG TPA: FHA domain-containing protein [Anaeromyxobacter sp.]|nr:FHA domain-containing protein [Anaeromyxobacter sp.]
MRHVLTILRTGVEPEERDLASAATAGGSLADLVSIAGAPAAALLLEPCAAGVVVEARATGVRAVGRPLDPGARRLLRPGEEVDLGGARIRLAPVVAPDATRAAAAALVRAAAASAGMPIAAPLLVVLTGAHSGACHPVVTEQILGRGRAAAIRIADPQASRRHARLCLGASGPSIEDLGSKNGLRVNGLAIGRRPCALRDGDQIAVGDTTLALVLGDTHAPAAAPPPAAVDAPDASPARLPGRHAAAAALLGLCAAALALAS